MANLVEVGRDNGVLAVIESGLQAGEEVAERSMDSRS